MACLSQASTLLARSLGIEYHRCVYHEGEVCVSGLSRVLMRVRVRYVLPVVWPQENVKQCRFSMQERR